MTSFDSGRRAEAAAASYLIRQGCAIIARNWRTRRCEIDIVAHRDDTIFCCEVKYRRSNQHGAGIEYVTPRKLRQMQFAAALWMQRHAWRGPIELVAIEVSGATFQITRVERGLPV